MNKRVLLGAALALSLGGLALVLRGQPASPVNKVEADVAPKVAASRIVQVTVYPNSALVTREVDVPAGTGVVELVVNPLPQHTVNSSLYSEGNDKARVLTTRFRTRPVAEDTREEVRKLEDECHKLQQGAQKVQADLKACEANMNLLGKLETFTAASTTHATEKGKMDADATIQLTKYVMEGRSDRTREMVGLQQQLEINKEQHEFAARKLRDLTSGSSRIERDAVIVVDKTDPAPGKVKLSYLVDQAAWHPQYKMRAGKTGTDPVQVEYLAAIMQQTGEDWTNVTIQLSTAQPMLNATPPDLNVLAVTVVPRGAVVSGGPMPPMGQQLAREGKDGKGDFLAPAFANPGEPSMDTAKKLTEAARGLRSEAQKDVNVKNSQRGNEIYNYAAALEQARDLVLVADEKKTGAGHLASSNKNEGPSVTYALPHRISVPSRNDEQVLEVARIDMMPDFFYKAVPILSPHIYRQANLVNKSKYVLLPGEATMYNGADFVGRMNLPLVAIGEQFTVGFGTEPQLQVNRQLVEKTRSMQGGNQIIKFEYRILLSSYKGEKVRVQVWDRLPFAEGGETLGVTLVKSTPELSKDALYVREEKPSNLLRWDVEVEPEHTGEKALEVSYEFKLELDKQMSIGTFQTKTAK
jgi:hypothetical protein